MFFYQNRHQFVNSLLLSMINIIRAELSYLLLIQSLCIYSHSCCLLSIICVSSIKAFMVKYKQMVSMFDDTKWNNRRRRPPLVIQYGRFLRINVRMLESIIEGNHFTGDSVFVYSVINFPLNCVFVIAIMSGVIETMYVFFIAVFALSQITCIFFIHLLIVSMNKSIHKPIKRVIHQSIYDRRLWKFSILKLKIHNYIVAFNTNKKYGYTYGSFGLVSMLSFSKVSPNFLFIILFVILFLINVI